FLNTWFVFFFSSRRRHTRFSRDWSSDVCSSDLLALRPWKRADVEPGLVEKLLGLGNLLRVRHPAAAGRNANGVLFGGERSGGHDASGHGERVHRLRPGGRRDARAQQQADHGLTVDGNGSRGGFSILE